MSASTQYAALPDKENEKDASAESYPNESSTFLEQQCQEQRLEKILSWNTTYTSLILSSILLITVIFTTVSLYLLHGELCVTANDISNLAATSPAFTQPPPYYPSCGDSPTVARARGCTFDVLSFTWQVPECYDEPLITSFLSYAPESWHWYTAPGGAEEVSLDVAALGERDLYVNWEYHIVHCTYMWMLMHRAYTVRGYIDSHLDAWNHTLHCQLVALDRAVGMDVVGVAGRVQYPECRAVGGPVGEGGPGEEIGVLKMPTREHPTAWHIGGGA